MYIILFVLDQSRPFSFFFDEWPSLLKKTINEYKCIKGKIVLPPLETLGNASVFHSQETNMDVFWDLFKLFAVLGPLVQNSFCNYSLTLMYHSWAFFIIINIYKYRRFRS